MELAVAWETQRVCDYIVQNGFTRVTLQFPDDMLHDAPLVADCLQRTLVQQGSAAKVYLLADTSYNPLSVDEVAAAHVNAECVIHYGYASLNPVSRIPALCILPKAQLSVQQCSIWVAQQLTDLANQTFRSNVEQQQQSALICCDQSYMHLLPQLRDAMLLAHQGPLQLVFATSAPVQLKPAGSNVHITAAQQHSCCSSSSITPSSRCCQHDNTQQQLPENTTAATKVDTSCSAGNSCTLLDTCKCARQGHQHNAAPSYDDSSSSSYLPPAGGLVWQLPSDPCCRGSSGDAQCMMVWIGPAESPALTHLQLTHSTHPWVLLEPVQQTVHQGLAPGLERLLKRRYYLVERARSATMVGLLVGTLGAAGYLQALNVLRALARQAGKKTYTLLMGKPNPAKLANFPEIEVFVMLADPQGLILDSKEYLNPIITPHEAYLAFTNKDFDAAAYKLDFGDLLQHQLQLQQQELAGNGPTKKYNVAAAELAGNVSSQVDADSDTETADSEGSLATHPGALIAAATASKAVTIGGRNGQQVQVHSAAQYLMQLRTYKGLETPASGAEMLAAEKAVSGRSGRAAAYVDEPIAHVTFKPS